MDNKEKKNNIVTGSIIVLVLVIAIGGFYFGKNTNKKVDIKTTTTTNNNNNIVNTKTGAYEDLTLTVIGDKRCGEECPTGNLIKQLKQLPSIANADIVVEDFSDKGVADYLKKNNIDKLPVFIFSTNNFDTSKDPVQTNPQTGKKIPTIDKFLKPIGNEFELNVGSTFKPFAKRSDKGLLLLDKTKLQAIKDSSYLKGNKDAKITWLEYSDLECPYCAKLHNSDTEKELKEKYGDNLNTIFNHFPLAFHENAENGAEILECLAEQKGSDAFYSLIDNSYTNKNSNKDYLIKEAVKLGANEDKLNKCLSDGTYTKKVKDMQNAGVELFGITGTPANVLINNKTGEYEIISGAYPTSEFEKVIDKLLK